jgi:Fe-S-cluster-containing hydrogenase component 2
MTVQPRKSEPGATEPAAAARSKTGWGKENYPYPRGAAHIECDEMKCVGCGICQTACAMKHFGVMNKELARIQVRKYLLPLPKAVQVTCVQCPSAERECEKACPVSPPAIHFDKQSLHMVVDAGSCLGSSCLQCRDACPAKAVASYPATTDIPFVCDLCDTSNSGHRDPQCINICPCGALDYVQSADQRYAYLFQDITRIHADRKAEMIAKRLYPLKKNTVWHPSEGGKNNE